MSTQNKPAGQENRIRKKNKNTLRNGLFGAIGILVVAAAALGVFLLKEKGGLKSNAQEKEQFSITDVTKNAAAHLITGSWKEIELVTTTDGTSTTLEVGILLDRAEKLASQYAYDEAIELLKSNEGNADAPEIAEAVNRYEEIKKTLVRADITKITHIFFHSLIIDTDKAFDGDTREAGYNQVMTTKDEFLKILESMYERGYVLVRLHDIAQLETKEDGSKEFVARDIMLPEGKKPFVMSQDDVCYYEYMDGDGFANRIVIGDDGLPTCEMKLDDGTTVTGDYDLVPILETFIQEHPGFSYKGARAVIAFTGYNGILGYRTAESYKDSPTYEQDRKDAAAVAQCLRDAGWELASHSWGHRDMGTIKMKDFKEDTDKWEREVESLIGPTDIILFPFGSDIGDWHPYKSDNERLRYLKSAGFDYYCNVDSSQYWVQMGKEFFRQGRRNLDGYRMYYDMIDPDSNKLGDLFDVEKVFDKSRPTPVPAM